VLKLTLPLRTVSGMNAREHPMARHRRVKKERAAVAWLLNGKPVPPLPVVVTMTRLAPSSGLDDDNLASAMKPVRDEIARWLGVDDRSPQVRWMPAQRREKAWGVEISVAADPGVFHGKHIHG
jgi:hypothetical protein